MSSCSKRKTPQPSLPFFHAHGSPLWRPAHPHVSLSPWFLSAQSFKSKNPKGGYVSLYRCVDICDISQKYRRSFLSLHFRKSRMNGSPAKLKIAPMADLRRNPALDHCNLHVPATPVANRGAAKQKSHSSVPVPST